MIWNKKGLIYAPNELRSGGGWKQQFAMLPTPLLIGDRLRIFLGFCDERNVGRIGYIDVNPDNPSEIYEVSDQPVVNIGKRGNFDDNGVVPASIVRNGSRIYLYYIGFQLGKNVPYYMMGGLAVSEDGGITFSRYSEEPVLNKTASEMYARCGINVIKDENKFKMWYIGSHKEGWVESQGKLRPLYTMKYTESDDGVHWAGESITCMDYRSEDEHGFGRPYVWRENNLYKMMYSIRTYSRGYYIGYAESENGTAWTRKDWQAGIDIGKDSWDDTNLSYPYIFSFKDKTYLFYNGNGCGKTGVGYAILQQE